MKIPAVIYGGHVETEMLMLDHQEVETKLLDEAYYSHVVSINVTGEKPQQVIMKAMHRHPSKPRILHIDFLRVVAGEKLKVNVPLHFINEDKCDGVKTGGGTVMHNMTELEIFCLPSKLPEYIEVDVLELKMGDTIHMTQLELPEGVEIAALMHGDEHDYDQIIASVTPPRVEQEDDDELTVPDADSGGDEGDSEGDGD
jgi:large subunit ribosomal protein L25